MVLKKLVGWLFYLCLLGLALDFCWENIIDYMDGKTYYSKTKKPLTSHDFPTLTICLPSLSVIYPSDSKQTRYNLGDNVDLVARVVEKEEKTVVLKENESVLTLYGLELLTESLQQNVHQQSQCFKIVPKGNGIGQFDFQKLRVFLTFTFNTSIDVADAFTKSTRKYHRPSVFATSEENSYGMAWDRWFDGYFGKKLGFNGRLLKIIDIIEHNNLETTCITDSYYECLAKRLIKLDFTKTTNKKFIDWPRHHCASVTNKDICSTIPLPDVGSVKIPLCRNDTHRECFESILGLLRESQKSECLRACHTLEYEIGKSMPWLENKKKKVKSNELMFGLKFDVKLWVLGSRSETLEKTVYNENLVYNLWELIGTVGGTLGVFVGFSMMGATTWFQDSVLPQTLKWIGSQTFSSKPAELNKS